MAFIRRVRTKSGATAVRIVKHFGSAHTEAELGVLMAQARERLEDPAQGVLRLGVEPTLPTTALVTPWTDAYALPREVRWRVFWEAG